jgi:preprotein translocase subunit SecE
MLEKIRLFLKEVKIEIKKVTWPSRRETMMSTVVVLIAVFIISFFLGFVDLGISKVMEQLFK